MFKGADKWTKRIASKNERQGVFLKVENHNGQLHTNAGRQNQIAQTGRVLQTVVAVPI